MRPTADERDEINAMWREAWEGQTVPAVVAGRALHLLRDAEQAQRQWATEMLDAAVRSGLREQAKTWRKRRLAPIVVSSKGKVVGEMQSAYSVPERRLDGKPVFALKRIVDMTWVQVESLLADTHQRIAAAQLTQRQLRKLLALRDLRPSSSGPADAANSANISLDQVLAA